MYRWIDHTAEVELEISAASERGVLEDALAALAELLLDDAPVPASQATVARRLSVSASDRPALLAAWLEELVFLAETEGFVGQLVVWLELRGESAEDSAEVEAEVEGIVGAPSPIVKAVTYHRLTFERSAGGYRATVVLDV